MKIIRVFFTIIFLGFFTYTPTIIPANPAGDDDTSPADSSEEILRQFQLECREYLDMLWSIADDEGIQMPPFPDEPYSEESVNSYYDHLVNELELKNQRIDTALIVDNLKEDIISALQSENPLRTLEELREKMYYQKIMNFLRETDEKAYYDVDETYLNAVERSQNPENMKPATASVQQTKDSPDVSPDKRDLSEYFTVFEDSFTNNAKNWPEVDIDRGSSRIQYGTYFLRHTPDEGVMYIKVPDLPVIGSGRDFYFETTIRCMVPQVPKLYGLVWGLESQALYVLVLNTNGSYYFYETDNLHQSVRNLNAEDTSKFRNNKYIATGDNANRITAVKENGLLVLSVNDRIIYKKSYIPSTMDTFGFFGVGRINFQIYDIRLLQK